MAALFIARLLAAGASLAQAQETTSADSLAVARSLFAEALKDEQGEKYPEALRKFQRVRDVRDTAAIEYRIGTCYEGLGKQASAYLAYRDAVALAGSDPANADVARASADRLDALDKHVARLTLILPQPAPADTEVRVDDMVVALAALGRPVVLDPGSHVVVATATSAAPFRGELVLPEGAGASMTISLGGGSPSTPSPGARPGQPWRTIGPVLLGTGGALVVASAALLVARQEDITTLDNACPRGLCPAGSSVSNLEGTRNRALVEGPLAATFGAAGVVAAGAGLYVVLANHNAGLPTAGLAPLVAWGTWGITVTGSFQ